MANTADKLHGSTYALQTAVTHGNCNPFRMNVSNLFRMAPEHVSRALGEMTAACAASNLANGNDDCAVAAIRTLFSMGVCSSQWSVPLRPQDPPAVSRFVRQINNLLFDRSAVSSGRPLCSAAPAVNRFARPGVSSGQPLCSAEQQSPAVNRFAQHD